MEDEMDNGDKKLLPRKELTRSAHRFLDAKNFKSAFACLEQLAGRYGKKPGTATDVLGILDRLPGFGAKLATGLTINVMKAAPDNSALQKKIAAKLLSFAFLEDTTPMLAAEAALQAARKLPSGDSACEAAIDTILDLAARTPEDEDSGFTASQRLIYIKAAAKRAVAGSALHDRSLDLWLDLVSRIDPGRRAGEYKALALESPPGSAAAGNAAHLWAAALRDSLASDPNTIEDVIPEVITTVSDPQTQGALEKEANELWVSLYRTILKKYDSEQALYMAAYTSGEIYKNSRAPEDCAQIKELAAASLLNLAKNAADPVFLYESIMAAAEYDGENKTLHKHIAAALEELLEDQEYYRPGQVQEIYRRLQDHKPPPPPQRPALPPPSPEGP